MPLAHPPSAPIDIWAAQSSEAFPRCQPQLAGVGHAARSATGRGNAARVMTSRRQVLRGLALGSFLAFSGQSRSHGLLPRRLLIERAGPQALSLSYALDPVDVLLAFLAPPAAPPTAARTLLQRWSEDSLAQFEHRMGNVRARLQRQTTLFTPGERQLPLREWVWPTTSVWHEAVRTAIVQVTGDLLQQEHSPEVWVRCQTSVPTSITRMQIRVPVPLHPLLVVTGPADKFWLTDLVPAGVLDV